MITITPLQNPAHLFSDKFVSVNAVFDVIPADRFVRPSDIAADTNWTAGFVELRCQRFYSHGYLTRTETDARDGYHNDYAYRRRTDLPVEHVRGFRVVG